MSEPTAADRALARQLIRHEVTAHRRPGRLDPAEVERRATVLAAARVREERWGPLERPREH